MTEIIFVYSLVFLFGGALWWLGALLVVGAFLVVSAIDNASARVRIDHLVRLVFMGAFMLAILAIGGLVYV
jgi:ech hydrogenase subunit B